MSDKSKGSQGPLEKTLGRVTQRITDQIGEAIVTGALVPEQTLPTESELVERYDASRSVLREAIKVLNAKGLVTAKPRRGTTVTPSTSWNLFDPDILRWILKRQFSLDLLLQFTQVRIGVEPQATRLAAQFATADNLNNITAGFERMEAAHINQDDELMADIAFHLAILDASQNMFFVRLKPLVETALNFSIRYTDDLTDDPASKLDQHYSVLQAIRKKQADKAEKASRALLTDVLTVMQKGMLSQPAKAKR